MRYKGLGTKGRQGLETAFPFGAAKPRRGIEAEQASQEQPLKEHVLQDQQSLSIRCGQFVNWFFKTV